MQSDYRVKKLVTEEGGDVVAICYDVLYGETFEKYIGIPEDFDARENASNLLQDSNYEISDEIRAELESTFGIAEFDADQDYDSYQFYDFGDDEWEDDEDEIDELVYAGNANGISTEDEEEEFAIPTKYLKRESFNLREALNIIDLNTYNKYDLLNLYESCNLSENEKRALANIVYDQNDPSVIYDTLNDRFVTGKEVEMPERVKDGVIHEETLNEDRASLIDFIDSHYNDDLDTSLRLEAEIKKLLGKDIIDDSSDEGIYSELSDDQLRTLKSIMNSSSNYDYFKEPAFITKGSLVDFGPYGKLYVCNPDYTDDYYWVTDDEEERYNTRAIGWSIEKRLAKRILESKSIRDKDIHEDTYGFKSGDRYYGGLPNDEDIFGNTILGPKVTDTTVDMSNNDEKAIDILQREKNNPLYKLILDDVRPENQYGGDESHVSYADGEIYWVFDIMLDNDCPTKENALLNVKSYLSKNNISFDQNSIGVDEDDDGEDVYVFVSVPVSSLSMTTNESKSIKEDIGAKTFSQWFDETNKGKYDKEWEPKYYPFTNYIKTFPNAEVLMDATAEDIKNNAHRFYNIYDVDSVDREYAFTFASEELGIDYDDFYYAWIKDQPMKGVNESLDEFEFDDEFNSYYDGYTEEDKDENSAFNKLKKNVNEEFYDFTGLNNELRKVLNSDEIDNHSSDLYVKKTPESTEILKKFNILGHSLCTTFIDQITHTPWYEIAFAYVPNEDDMGTYFDDIQPELEESVNESLLPNAVELLYIMDKFVLDVYDNESWLMNGIPDGEFNESSADSAKQNWKDHSWLVIDENGNANLDDFREFVDVFRRCTRSKDYDQEERNSIIAKAEELLKSNLNESKSINESRPDKDIKTTTNKVDIKYGNSVKEVETCKPIKVTKKQLDSYKDNYSIVDVLTESKSIKESSYKKGDRVELDNGMTGTVTKDFDWENDDQVSVEIDGTKEMRYPRSETLKDLRESSEETPYTKEEIERDLKSITHNFTDKDGELKCGFEEEKNFGVEILKQHYKVVETSGDDRRDGTWYHISFAEPKNVNEDLTTEYEWKPTELQKAKAEVFKLNGAQRFKEDETLPQIYALYKELIVDSPHKNSNGQFLYSDNGNSDPNINPNVSQAEDFFKFYERFQDLKQKNEIEINHKWDDNEKRDPSTGAASIKLANTNTKEKLLDNNTNNKSNNMNNVNNKTPQLKIIK